MDVRNRSAWAAIYYQNHYKEKAYKKYWEEGGREIAALKYRGLYKTKNVKNADEVVETVQAVQKYVKEIIITFD